MTRMKIFNIAAYSCLALIFMLKRLRDFDNERYARQG